MGRVARTAQKNVSLRAQLAHISMHSSPIIERENKAERDNGCDSRDWASFQFVHKTTVENDWMIYFHR